MRQGPFRAVIAGLTAALVVSAAALALARGSGQLDAGLQIAPFVASSVIAIHVVMTLPLSWLAALRLSFHCPTWLAGTLAAVAAMLTVIVGKDLAAWIERGAGSFPELVLARATWCLALQVPWCILAMRLSRNETQSTHAGGWALAMAGFAALVPPALYVIHLTGRQAATLPDLLARGRVTRALSVTEQICQLGRAELLLPADERPVGGDPRAGKRSIGELRVQLRREVRELTDAVKLPLTPGAHPIIRRARQFAQLDRLDEAEELLRPVAGDDSAAMLLFAALLQDRQRWGESDEWYRSALARRRTALERDPRAFAQSFATVAGAAASPLATLAIAADSGQAMRDCIRAYDGLAFNARGRGALAQSEAYYREAMDRIPPARAHFHFQLGRHYEQADRPAAAIEQFNEAARLAPREFEAAASARITRLQQHTPACLLGRPTPSAGASAGSTRLNVVTD